MFVLYEVSSFVVTSGGYAAAQVTVTKCTCLSENRTFCPCHKIIYSWNQIVPSYILQCISDSSIWAGRWNSETVY